MDENQARPGAVGLFCQIVPCRAGFTGEIWLRTAVDHLSKGFSSHFLDVSHLETAEEYSPAFSPIAD